jgi:hypothetical protein
MHIILLLQNGRIAAACSQLQPFVLCSVEPVLGLTAYADHELSSAPLSSSWSIIKGGEVDNLMITNLQQFLHNEYRQTSIEGFQIIAIPSFVKS